jgi:hypothetical protein
MAMPSFSDFIHHINKVSKEKWDTHPLYDSFSYIKNIMTFVFYHERQKRIIFWKVRFWPYYLHNADNMANHNLPSKMYVNSNINAKN